MRPRRTRQNAGRQHWGLVSVRFFAARVRPPWLWCPLKPAAPYDSSSILIIPASSRIPCWPGAPSGAASGLCHWQPGAAIIAYHQRKCAWIFDDVFVFLRHLLAARRVGGHAEFFLQGVARPSRFGRCCNIDVSNPTSYRAGSVIFSCSPLAAEGRRCSTRLDHFDPHLAQHAG